MTEEQNWRQEYISLKGWENMSSGQKMVATQPIKSSAMGMGAAAMKKELEELRAKARDERPEARGASKTETADTSQDENVWKKSWKQFKQLEKKDKLWIVIPALPVLGGVVWVVFMSYLHIFNEDYQWCRENRVKGIDCVDFAFKQGRKSFKK